MATAAMRAFLLVVLTLGSVISYLLSGRLGWPLAILSSFCAAVAIHALVVALGFFLARVRAFGQHASKPGWLAALPFETIISMRNMYLDIPWRHRWPTHRPAQAFGAILLVHGYGCNRGIWHGFHQWLAGKNWIVAGITLEPLHADIDELGKQLALGIRALARDSGQDSIIVIAHSMGGLAIRAAMHAEPNLPIHHVITIATPHHGTCHARLALGECATQMLPGSTWLDKLAIHSPNLADKFSCIASVHDNIVTPPTTALLEHSPYLLRDKVGHMALLHDKQVRAFIALRLQQLLDAV